MPRGRTPKAGIPQVPTKHIKITYTRNPGHPTYYSAEMGDKLIEAYAQGKRVAGFCVSVGIGKSTFHDWVNEYPEFAEAYEFAKLCSQALAEEVLKEQAFSNEKAPNATQMAMIMNNWFKEDYSRNPQEVSTLNQTNNVNLISLGTDQIAKRIAELLKSSPDLVNLLDNSNIIDVTPEDAG